MAQVLFLDSSYILNKPISIKLCHETIADW